MPANESAQHQRRTRAEAARENGRKSHGPVTPEGKHKAATASLKHNLTGKCVVLANECPRRYESMRDEYFEEWQPQGRTETDLLVAAVNCNWRLQRIWGMESALIDSAMFYKRGEFEESYETPTAAMRAADAVCALNVANKANLETLHRYEVTYSRMFERSLASLRKLRHARGAASDPEPRLRRRDETASQPANQPANEAPTLTIQLPPFKLPQFKLPQFNLPSIGKLFHNLRLMLVLMWQLLTRSERIPANPSSTAEAAIATEPVSNPEPYTEPYTGYSGTGYNDTGNHHNSPSLHAHESLCDMPREEFLALHSGTFTMPEHLHYESEFTAPKHLWIPNGCVGCPACNEREEREEREQQEAEAAQPPAKSTRKRK